MDILVRPRRTDALKWLLNFSYLEGKVESTLRGQAVRFARLVLSKVEEQMSATLQESVAGETINQEDVTAAVKSTSRARRQVAKILFSQFPRQSARAAIQQALEQARRIPTSTTTSAQEWRLVAGRQVSPSWSESCGMVEMVKESLPRELAKDFFAEVKKVGVAFATHALLDAVAVAAANSSLTSDGLSQVPDLGNIECGPNYVKYFLRPPSGWSQICEQRLIAYENDLAAANCGIALNTPLACNTFRRICGHIWAGMGNSRAFSDHIRGFSGMVIPACMFVTGKKRTFSHFLTLATPSSCDDEQSHDEL
ncbi:hypothetical protein GNI_025700 [Gregarina niphandrodes]|uniref:Uncharacterized protein n=1 Tax=Gregarina niphandrodes TaxID=110365 RepID=A0A023BBC5_GRENI|nr:hypothetical protein GNI_025700 [Gregarina niphandrodes]EZG79514.1 hypothetical protein GNI_025700 [Gregarina niphandrodes]|eukprot:XP_011134420.1 hypothetical protein GNI_025700 [Gregarina niphandrodes]